jgi:hypothetical protein
MPEANSDKWFNMTHSREDDDTAQEAWIYNSPPPENFPTQAMIFVRVCVKDF